jgi:1-acyl-sn-glycerol-3-phosphate acyltransferase
VDAGAPETKVNWIPIVESLDVLRLARRQKAVRNAILGISWFWFFGTILTAQLPSYAPLYLGGDETLYILALALFSVGTGIGSLLCERMSGRTVELGLVPLGAFGMTAFCVDLVQSRTPKSEISRVVAALNIQNAAFIVTAAVLALVAQRVFGWSIPQLYLATGIATAIVAIVIFSIVPEFVMRFVAWNLTHALYRARITGIEEYVPDQGPALIVCNHVSYTDPLILGGAIPRPTRFVMYHKIFNTPGASWLFRTARAIPIAGRNEDPELMERAFAEVDAALAAGEIVGIFPEGKLTTDGEIAEFKSGVERILRTRPVPVVPMALRGMWASVLSRQSDRWGRLPKRLRARIELEAGPPVDGATATAESLEALVRALRGPHR